MYTIVIRETYCLQNALFYTLNSTSERKNERQYYQFCFSKKGSYYNTLIASTTADKISVLTTLTVAPYSSMRMFFALMQ